MNLFYIDIIEKHPNITVLDQLMKLEEEKKEIAQAIINKNDENLIEECWDLIQATLGVIKLKGLENEFKRGFKSHEAKLLNRGYTKENF